MNSFCFKVLLCENFQRQSCIEQSISYEITEKIGRKVFPSTWNIGLNWLSRFC